MLCGLGIPSLRSLLGAVRNRHLCMLHAYYKRGIIFFTSPVFSFYNYTNFRQKNYTH